MPKVRVTFLWETLQQIGGVGTFLRRCLEILPAHAVEPSVVELEWPTPAGNIPGASGGNVIHGQARWWQTPIGYHRAVVRAISALRPHVIVCNNQYGWKYLPTFQGRVPIMDIIHVDFPKADSWQQVAVRSGQFDRLVGVSDSIAERLRALCGSADKVLSIPYGVKGENGPRQGPTEAGPIILFVGRLSRRHKRIQDLLPFVQALAGAVPDYSLIVIGDGPDKEVVQECVREGRGKVVATGALLPEQIVPYYQRAHFLVLFSEFEGLSIALLEAMAHGVVPVATAIESGVRQVVQDGVNGYLFPVGQPQAAARIIKSSLPRWAECSLLACQTAAANFGMESMAKRYATLFHSLAREPLHAETQYVDEGYDRLQGKLARRLLPIGIYRGLLGRIV